MAWLFITERECGSTCTDQFLYCCYLLSSYSGDELLSSSNIMPRTPRGRRQRRGGPSHTTTTRRSTRATTRASTIASTSAQAPSNPSDDTTSPSPPAADGTTTDAAPSPAVSELLQFIQQQVRDELRAQTTQHQAAPQPTPHNGGQPPNPSAIQGTVHRIINTAIHITYTDNTHTYRYKV